jgi:hypothetical protein
MDGQRFDEIARRLAGAVSRRSLLKGLIGSAAAAVGVGRPVLRTDEAKATSPCPAAESTNNNKQTGSCDTVKSYIQSTGVWSRLGGNHPTKSGWTDSKFEVITQIRFDLVSETDPFTNQTCYRPANLEPVYKVTSKVYQINWQPSEPLSTCCEQERQRWTSAVYTHECRHVSDDHGIVQQRNTGMANFVSTDQSFRICGVRESTARNQLKAMIRNEANQGFEALQDDADQLAENFHNSPEGAEPGLDCRKCQSCAQVASVGATSEMPIALQQDMCCANGQPPCGNGCDAVCCAEGEECIDGQCQCPIACREDECCHELGECCLDSAGVPLGCCPANYNCGITERECCCDARQFPFDICCPAGGCCISSTHPVCCAGAPFGVGNFCCFPGTECCVIGGTPSCCPPGGFDAARSAEGEATPTAEPVPAIPAGGSTAHG